MKKLLVVESSSRGETSVSHQMMERFLHHWRAANTGGETTVRDLTTTPLEFTTASWLQAYFTPQEHHTSAMKDALSLSDALAAEVLAADEIAISTPVYNYNVPAVLKSWIDHIVRKGITLGADGSGLLASKKATVLIASGGFYGEGSPIADRDIATRYLQLILNVIGIDDVTVVAGGGAKAVDLGEATMDAFIGSHEDAIKSAAA